MKKLLSVFILSLLATSMWGLGTTTFSVPTGNNYYAAYEVLRTNPNNYNWVQTEGSPGNSGSSYTAPTGWLDGGSGKPGYGYINVQSGKTVSFYVTNCTSVKVLGAANSGTRTLNLSVTNNGTEVGSVATITGTTIQELTYGTTLDATKSYVITISASSANNGKFHQILLVGGSSTGGGGGGQTTTTYTITYNNNGHGTAPAQVTDATALPATLPNLTESGWTFGGWYTDATLTTPAVAGATLTANTTLYAKWTQDSGQGGGQQGGSSTDCGELIKVVLSGSNGSTQTVTGTIGGTAGVKSMGSSSPYKLNSDGAYVYIKLADGHYFQAGDVLTIDGSKAMEVHTGDVANGTSTMLDHTASPSNGVITYTLPATLPANTNTLSVYRSSSTYNGTLTYMAVNRICTGPSTDATLSELKVDGVTVAGFNPNTMTYNVTIPATQTTAPVVTATKNNSKAANPTIQQAALPTVGNSTTATVMVTAEDGTTTKTYTITFTRAELSHDADLKDIKVNSQSIIGFAASTTTYSVELPFGTTTAANVTATANYAAATVQITQPTSTTGTATIVVTAEDGTKKTYTLTFTIGEEPDEITITPTPGGGFSGLNYNGENSIPSGYTLSGSNPPIIGNASAGMSDGGKYINLCDGGGSTLSNGIPEKRFMSFELDADCVLEVKFYSASNNREFHICDEQGNHLFSKAATTKDQLYTAQYTFTGITQRKRFYFYGTSNSNLYLTRIHFEYTTSLYRHRGNDSTQSILATTAIKPITYVAHAATAPIAITWIGGKANGITLSAGIGDTIMVSGTAQCNPGTYQYRISTTNAQGVTLSQTGKFTVSTKIQRQTPDSLVEGFTGEVIDDIQFKYYALSGDSVVLTWTGNTPAGISGSGTNGIYTISGTPTQVGDFPFAISVKGGNSINGCLRVQNSELGANPILYLYKNSYDNAFYQNMISSNYNLVARKAKTTLREMTQYAAYDLIIISEDVDANNAEAMAAAEGQIARPVLNMKGFTYAADRLGWGDPDNGSLKNTKITVMQPTHPIFNGLNATEGGQIQILDTVTGKGLMPVKVEKDTSLCLATAATRGREYNTDGVQQTFLHEIPAAQRNGQKYLLFPLAVASSNKLTANGKKLLQNCIDYLKNNTPSRVVLPELQITSFTVNGIAAAINQTDNTIELTMPQGTDLKAVAPVVTLKDSKTHVAPRHWNKDGVTVDLSNDYMGLDYIVTDYINVRVYTVYAHVENPEGLDEIYADGEWINIYDIQGRKIMTTNESLHQLSLSRGMYIVVTSRGSFKIFK